MIIIEPDFAYHEQPSISRSGLWEIYSRTPAHFIGREKEPSKAQDVGHIAHWALLQPELLAERIAVSKKLNKNTNEWKTFAATAELEGKIAIQQQDLEPILRMADIARAHPIIREFVEDCVIENSHYWEEDGVQLKARPDARSPGMGLLLDYKTAADASARMFSNSIGRYGYHLQDFMYRRGVVATGEEAEGMIFLAQEKEAPFEVAVYEIVPDDLKEAAAIYDKALATYRACKEANEWPGYSKEIQPISIPRWAVNETRDDSTPAA